MERKLPICKLTRAAPSEGSRMMEELLSHEIAVQRAGRVVGASPNSLGKLWRIAMRPDEGYIQVVSVVPRLWSFRIITLS